MSKTSTPSDTVSITGSNDIASGGSSYDFSALGSITFGSNGTSATDWTTGSPNTVWTTTGTGYNWNTVTNPVMIEQSGKVSLKGEKADIDIDGKSLKNWMEKVEERLNILTPNPELEVEWDELRRLGERYRKLEKRCQEKSEVWRRLSDNSKSDKT